MGQWQVQHRVEHIIVVVCIYVYMLYVLVPSVVRCLPAECGRVGTCVAGGQASDQARAEQADEQALQREPEFKGERRMGEGSLGAWQRGGGLAI